VFLFDMVVEKRHTFVFTLT